MGRIRLMKLVNLLSCNIGSWGPKRSKFYSNYMQCDLPGVYEKFQLIFRCSFWIIIARPKGGLFRYHVKRIHFTRQGFGFLSAILRQNWWPCTTTTEVPPLFNLARFDLNKDCCWKNYLQTDSDYFSHSIGSFINCVSIEITIQLNS